MYISASGVQCEMPVAPWIWIAWSMMVQTFSGTMAFTMLTQMRASRLPSTSIALAAFSTMSLMASISMRARDNLPSPKTSDENPYVPQNSPAIGDLWGNFDFDHPGDDDN